MGPLTAGFSSVTQFSEAFLNRLVRRLYDTNVIPHQFNGNNEEVLQRYGIHLSVAYSISLGPPRIVLDTNSPRRLRLFISLSGWLRLRSTVEASTDGPGADFEHVVTINSGELAVAADIGMVGAGGMRALQISFHDVPLQYYEVDLDIHGVPAAHSAHLAEIIRRILFAKLRDQVRQLPLSHSIQTDVIGEYQIVDLDWRNIIDREDRALGLHCNSLPNSGGGSAAHIANLCGGVFDFAMAVDGQLLTELVDLSMRRGHIPDRYNDQGRPDPRGKTRLRALVIALRAGKIQFSIKLSRDDHLPLPEWLHGAVVLQVHDGYLSAELRDVEIELPMIAEVVGFLGLGIAWLVVSKCLRQALGGLIEEAVNVQLENFIKENRIRFAFSGTVPGTMIRVVAQVVAVELLANEMGTRGQVLLEALPV